MRRAPVVVGLSLIAASLAGPAAAQPVPCDPHALRHAARTARDNVIAGVDGAGALDAWRTVLDAGGAIAWPATEYNVDARGTFVLAFDRAALRVYRAGAFGPALDAAMDGCLDPATAPEAVIPWQNVREIRAGNWVLWFKLRTPVGVSSDRGARRNVDELKVYFHGGPGGDLTYRYDLEYEGRVPFWNVDVYRVENLRGIAVGPTGYQRRLQYVIGAIVDPHRRIAMTRKGRGAGW
jgi:hypothetical protein